MGRKRHSPEEVVNKLRQADVELGKGSTIAAVCKAHGSRTWFATRVTSTQPLAASMNDWDLAQRGGWENLGRPLDVLTPF